MATGTSFQRKTRVKVPQISGVKPSLQNNQLLVSTGVPSFDSVIGGGIAIGSVLLIEEDTYGSYSRLLLRYYLAESVLCKHAVHLSGADVPPDNLLQDLPGPVLDGPAQPTEPTASGESLKIAWRYQNQPQVQPGSVSSKFGHYYDLTKTMPAERLQGIDKTCFDATQIDHSECVYRQMDGQTGRYGALLQSIQETIMKGGFSTSSAQEHRNILRIGIHSLGSPLWGENGGLGAALPRFLYALRALLRSAYATCMITMPTHLFHEAAFTWRVEKLCDTVVSLQSFVGSDREKNPVYKEYHGMFNVVSLPHLNSLVSHQPDTVDWAFKLRRKKFTIEKLHLPPELSETMSRPQEDPVQAKTTGCGGASGTSKLDF